VRLNGVWDHHAALIRHHAGLLAPTKDWTPDDFSEPLDGLAGELVSLDAYRRAVNHGRRAVDGVARDDDDPVIETWVGHVRAYADEVPDRLASELADEANAAQAEEDSSVASVLARIDRKLEALRSSVTRYAEPTWGAGWNGYGAQLQQRNILMAWILEDGADHCDDCISLADGSPYENLPSWPGYGETACRDRCKCHVSADQESWDAAMGEAA
jgi:hypothetical protein